MPKVSEAKRNELEEKKAKLVTKPAERKPIKDYLGQVTQREQKNRKFDETHGKTKKNLSQVTSLPNLNPRQLQTEQKIMQSPHSTKPDSTRVFNKGRNSEPPKGAIDLTTLPVTNPGNMGAYIDWHKSQLQSTMGNRNMQYAKKKLKVKEDIFDEQELSLVQNDPRQKRDQLAILNQKVKQFE